MPFTLTGKDAHLANKQTEITRAKERMTFDEVMYINMETLDYQIHNKYTTIPTFPSGSYVVYHKLPNAKPHTAYTQVKKEKPYYLQFDKRRH